MIRRIRLDCRFVSVFRNIERSCDRAVLTSDDIVTDDVTPAVASSGGGSGAFNPLALIFGYLVLVSLSSRRKNK